MTDSNASETAIDGSAASLGSTDDLTFTGQKRTIERIKKLIRNDVKVNRAWSQLRAAIERDPDSGVAALTVLSMLAADPVESKKLIDAIREPRDRSYERSY